MINNPPLPNSNREWLKKPLYLIDFKFIYRKPHKMAHILLYID